MTICRLHTDYRHHYTKSGRMRQDDTPRAAFKDKTRQDKTRQQQEGAYTLLCMNDARICRLRTILYEFEWDMMIRNTSLLKTRHEEEGGQLHNNA
jgi:hypothetical protein